MTASLRTWVAGENLGSRWWGQDTLDPVVLDRLRGGSGLEACGLELGGSGERLVGGGLRDRLEQIDDHGGRRGAIDDAQPVLDARREHLAHVGGSDLGVVPQHGQGLAAAEGREDRARRCADLDVRMDAGGADELDEVGLDGRGCAHQSDRPLELDEVVIALTNNPVAEIRKTAAWVMGQDPSAEEFHRALLPLLSDSEPLVRRNAALQLVRFADASGRAELRAMLQPFEVKSTMAGTIVSILPPGTKIKAGGLLARIRDASNTVQELRSPLDGATASVSTKEGEAVTVGQPIAHLAPDRSTVVDALRGLAHLGNRGSVRG